MGVTALALLGSSLLAGVRALAVLWGWFSLLCLLAHVPLAAPAKQGSVVCYVRVAGRAFLQQESEAFRYDAPGRQNQANFNSCLLQAIVRIKEAL